MPAWTKSFTTGAVLMETVISIMKRKWADAVSKKLLVTSFLHERYSH